MFRILQNFVRPKTFSPICLFDKILAKIRKKIPIAIETDLLYKSHHTCSICNINGIAVHIHHIDGDTTNYSDDNLIVLCLVCHDRVEKEGKLGRKFKKFELLQYRSDWEQKVKQTFQPVTNFDHYPIQQFQNMLDEHVGKIEFMLTKKSSGKKSSKKEKPFDLAIQTLYETASKYYTEEKYDEALELSRKAALLKPKWMEQWMNLDTFCYVHKNDKVNAIKTITASVKKYPKSVYTLSNTIAVYLTFKNLKKAIQYSDKFLKIFPNDQEGLIQKGFILENMIQFSDSLKYYEQVLKITPKNKHALHHIINVCMKMDNPEKALKHSNTLIKITTKEATHISRNGILNCQLNNHQQALKSFTIAESLDKTKLEYKYDKIIELRHLDRKKEMVKEITKHLRTYPTDPQLLHFKGIWNCESNKHQTALNSFELALSVHPDDTNLLYSKALELSHLEKKSKSLKVYDEVLKKEPKHVEALINKSNLIMNKNPKTALLLLNKALRIQPDHMVGLTNMLILLTNVKQFKKVESVLQKLVHIKPDSILIRFFSGVIKYHQGDESAALKHLKIVSKQKKITKELLTYCPLSDIRRKKKFKNLFSELS